MYWYLLKTILSSVLGSSFYQWFKNTKVGVWWQDKLDDFMEYVSVKYDINIAKRDSLVKEHGFKAPDFNE